MIRIEFIQLFIHPQNYCLFAKQQNISPTIFQQITMKTTKTTWDNEDNFIKARFAWTHEVTMTNGNPKGQRSAVN